jgi:NTE family protein
MRNLKLGLALGPGGMKGAAHIGVMRVLADAGIQPDVIAGTSIGSLYGGLAAVGRTAHEIEDGIRTCPSREVYDLFRGRLRIRAKNRLARRFYEALAGHHIEDLPIAYGAVASDIARRETIAITSGPIIDAIEASIAIPVIARPVRHQGLYLLDGGVYEAAPIDAAHQLGADVIIAVQITRPAQIPQRLRAGAKRFASMLEFVAPHRTLAGLPFSINAFSTDLREGRSAQVTLRPQVRGFNRHTAGRMVDCLEAGIAAATEALPAIEALLAGEAPSFVAEEFAPDPRPLFADPGLA